MHNVLKPFMQKVGLLFAYREKAHHFYKQMDKI